jgi:hypothetical protein
MKTLFILYYTIICPNSAITAHKSVPTLNVALGAMDTLTSIPIEDVEDGYEQECLIVYSDVKKGPSK